jgi:hypothetical protein
MLLTPVGAISRPTHNGATNGKVGLSSENAVSHAEHLHPSIANLYRRDIEGGNR